MFSLELFADEVRERFEVNDSYGFGFPVGTEREVEVVKDVLQGRGERCGAGRCGRGRRRDSDLGHTQGRGDLVRREGSDRNAKSEDDGHGLDRERRRGPDVVSNLDTVVGSSGGSTGTTDEASDTVDERHVNRPFPSFESERVT